jgi:hypothetical protein
MMGVHDLRDSGKGYAPCPWIGHDAGYRDELRDRAKVAILESP